jgi:cytochrome c553
VGSSKRLLTIQELNMKIDYRIGLIAGLVMLGAQSARAEGDAQAGQLKAETCLGCHAAPNAENTYPMYRVPKVGGQNAPYIIAALKAYQTGERPHRTMQANTSNLSDQDIEDIAAFFSSVK